MAAQCALALERKRPRSKSHGVQAALGSHRECISTAQLTLEGRDGEPGKKHLQEKKLHEEKEETNGREKRQREEKTVLVRSENR